MSAIPPSTKVSAGGFGAALLDPASGTPAGLIGPDGWPDPKRFNVYRNNVIVSLVEALGQTYPAIKALLGDEYFAALARAFVGEHPPASPVLIWYGADFADFVAGFPPLEPYPYLGDVARLEWAWLQAYHAADVSILDPSELGEVTPEELGTVQFVRHPAAAVVMSEWPVWDLVRINRFEKDTQCKIDLSVAQSVLITRPEFDVDIHLLPSGGDEFVDNLFSGSALGEAAEAAHLKNGGFSLSGCLSDLLSNGAFKGLRRVETV
jgi:hypothetical protein